MNGAFERELVTPSRWDAFLNGTDTALTNAEKVGLQEFLAAGCPACHNGSYLGGTMFQKAGTARPWPDRADPGRYALTKNPADSLVFKVPGLRNVERTAPYFHDGQVARLDDAVRLMARHQLGKELTDSQVAAVVAWLGALTGTIPADYIAPPKTAD